MKPGSESMGRKGSVTVHSPTGGTDSTISHILLRVLVIEAIRRSMCVSLLLTFLPVLNYSNTLIRTNRG